MWHADVVAEKLMKEIGIPYSLKTGIPISKIDLDLSSMNNARMSEALDDERILKYSYEMSKGNSFPFPVLVLKPNGVNYLILAGNQRTNAARKSGWTTIDAYVVDPSCPAEMIDDFIRRDNTRHGKPISDEDKVQMCVFLHRKHKQSMQDLCAKYFGENRAAYGRIVNANMAAEVEARLKGKLEVVKLPASALVELHQIQDINVLVDAFRLSVEYNLPVAQIADLASEIGKKTSEAERKSVVSAWKVQLDSRVKTGSVQPDVLLRKHLSSFSKFLNTGFNGITFPALDRLTTDKKQVTEFKATIDAIMTELKRLKERTR